MKLEELADWIEDNFASASEFAAWMSQEKIRGRMYCSTECPLTHLAKKRIENSTVTVGLHSWYWVGPDGEKMSEPLGKIAKDFRRKFDAGRYPQLVG